jgi:hypothetical protein
MFTGFNHLVLTLFWIQYYSLVNDFLTVIVLRLHPRSREWFGEKRLASPIWGDYPAGEFLFNFSLS